MKINYISQGSGITFVFQHGLTASANQIEKLLGGLDGIHILSIDCPGHGKTILPSDYLPSFDNYADNVIEFLNDQGIEKAFFGGLSMGSGIALNIAIRHPEKVQALVLHRPAWLDEGYPENLRILLPGAEMIGQPNAVSEFQKLTEYDEMNSEIPQAAASVLGIFNPEQQSDLPKVIRQMIADRPFNHMSDLEKLKVPCLILGNDDDPLHPFTMAVQIHNRIKGSKLVKLTSRYINNEVHRTEVRENISTFVQQLRNDL